MPILPAVRKAEVAQTVKAVLKPLLQVAAVVLPRPIAERSTEAVPRPIAEESTEMLTILAV